MTWDAGMCKRRRRRTEAEVYSDNPDEGVLDRSVG